MHYRKEIDGLRAVAVLPVILFHAGFSSFEGGFIGVDIFFVISGYLITSLIIEEREQGSFSLSNFYERRARRILPALSLVLLVTTLFAYLLLSPNLLQLYSQSLAATATFASNIFFIMTNNYFSSMSELKPLLHTWSLSVEEQFYVFFPLLIVFCWALGKKKLFSLILSLALLSIIFSEVLLFRGHTNSNFFLIFSRMWELLFGSAIAFLFLRKISHHPILKETASIIGLSLIICAIALFNDETPFPGLYALAPVVATCLIIYFADSSTLVGKILANKVLVTIGLLSYSLYLWHQPLFAFLKLKILGVPSMSMHIVAIWTTFVLAFATWKYVETPFRNRKSISSKQVLAFSVASVVLFSGLGLIGHLNQGFESRFNLPNYRDSIVSSPVRNDCHTVGTNYLTPAQACRYFSDNVTWAALGDSHIVEPAYVLAKVLQQEDIGLLHLSFSSCMPALSIKVEIPGCNEWLEEAVSYLEHSNSIENVLVSFRHSLYLFGDQLKTYPELPNEDPVELYSNKSISDSREVYWQSFKILLNRLTAANKTVHIIYPVPDLPVHIDQAVAPFSIFSSEPLLNVTQATSADYYFRRHEYILNKLDALEYTDQLFAVKPFEIFCNDLFCPAIIDNQSLYYDDDHLSLYGSQLIIENLLNNSALISPAITSNNHF